MKAASSGGSDVVWSNSYIIESEGAPRMQRGNMSNALFRTEMHVTKQDGYSAVCNTIWCCDARSNLEYRLHFELIVNVSLKCNTHDELCILLTLQFCNTLSFTSFFSYFAHEFEHNVNIIDQTMNNCSNINNVWQACQTLGFWMSKKAIIRHSFSGIWMVEVMF